MRAMLWLKAALYAVIVVVALVSAIGVLAAPLGQVELPTTFGSNYLLASALVGVLLPAALALLMQRGWQAETKGAVAAALSIVAAVLVTFTQGVLDPADYLRSILIVFTLAQVLYQTFYKPSGIAPAIERRTTLRV